MIHPPTYPAAKLPCFTPDQLKNPEQTCLCGRKVPLASTLVAWSHPTDSEQYGWYSICNQGCFTAHMREGNA